jgi:hypothetical protein
MVKKREHDIIAEAHERANHNINPYYWVNRVTSFTLAGWKANKYLSPIFFFIYSVIGVLVLNSQNLLAEEQGKDLLGYLIDFSDSATSTRAVGALLYVFYWAVLAIGTVQSIMKRITSSPPSSSPRPKKRKEKKYPKRRKDYR